MKVIAAESKFIFYLAICLVCFLFSNISKAQQSFNDYIQISDNIDAYPYLELIRDNDGTSQTWRVGNNLYDLAGVGSNEFSIVDWTGSAAPFTIFAGAPNQSLVVDADGTVSLRAGRLTVVGDSADEADVQVYVENANSATFGSVKKLFVIKNNGAAKFSMVSSDTDEWAFNALDNAFRISKQGSGQVEMEVTETGNLVIQGTLTQGSSRATKQNIESVFPESILEKVVSLPIAEWSYKRDGDAVRHLGPMAEDFFAAFGLGKTEKGLTSIDTSGVALAAIQGLKQEKDTQLAEKDAEIAALHERLTEQGKRIQQMELAIVTLLDQKEEED